MLKLKLVILIYALATSVAIASYDFSVNWQGALSSVHQGDTSGKVPLHQFIAKKNLYALGPVAELDGEITVIDGKFHIARVRHGNIKMDNDLSIAACFLVWSEVTAWQLPMTLGEKVASHAQLEKLVANLAKKSGLDINKPFPFMLEGDFRSVNYHVLSPVSSHETGKGHNERAKKISLENVDAKIVGFFSTNHEGIFTHKGSHAHLHIIESGGSSGHVDELSLNENTRVLFPYVIN